MGHCQNRLVLKNSSIYNIKSWLPGSLGQMNCRPSIQCSKYNYIYFKFANIKIKSFEWPMSIRNYKKNDAWNIGSLVDDSFPRRRKERSWTHCANNVYFELLLALVCMLKQQLSCRKGFLITRKPPGEL